MNSMNRSVAGNRSSVIARSVYIGHEWSHMNTSEKENEKEEDDDERIE